MLLAQNCLSLVPWRIKVSLEALPYQYQPSRFSRPTRRCLVVVSFVQLIYVSWYKILTSNQWLFLKYLQNLSQVSDTKCAAHLRLLTTVDQAIAPHDPIYWPSLIWLLPKIFLNLFSLVVLSNAIMYSSYL